MASDDKNRKGGQGGRADCGKVRYVTVYRHYRTGKMMKASDYGYKAWPFGPKNRKGG